MDETSVKVRGEWVYLYRAGTTIAFRLSPRRDVAAASPRSPEAESPEGVNRGLE